jgi:simple sugar transport system permease protein
LVVAPIVGVLAALLVGAVLIRIAGQNPWQAYGTMLKGAFGGERQWTETILKMCPLLLIGLGLSVSFHCRTWNIGAEGQYYIGALVGGVVGLAFPGWPAFVLIPAMLAGGLLGGVLWSAIPAILKVKQGMSEIISTLMLNYIAVLIVEYVSRGPLQEPGGYLPETAQFVKAARIPRLFGSRIHVGVLIAILLVPAVYFLIWRTPIGFRIRMVGQNPDAARFAGVRTNSSVFFTMLFSGALAGMAGLIEVSSSITRLKGAISGNYGFNGILVALLGRLNPYGVLVAAVLFAGLTIGAESMHTLSGLPIAIAQAIQALVVLFVLAADAIVRYRR